MGSGDHWDCALGKAEVKQVGGLTRTGRCCWEEDWNQTWREKRNILCKAKGCVIFCEILTYSAAGEGGLLFKSKRTFHKWLFNSRNGPQESISSWRWKMEVVSGAVLTCQQLNNNISARIIYSSVTRHQYFTLTRITTPHQISLKRQTAIFLHILMIKLIQQSHRFSLEWNKNAVCMEMSQSPRLPWDKTALF